MPDGIEYRGDSSEVHEALSKWLGFPVTLAREETISHFDEGPVSIITTSSLRMVSQHLGEVVDVRRFRANLLIDTDSTQEDLHDDSRILRILSLNHGATFGVWASVETSGEIAVDDETTVG